MECYRLCVLSTLRRLDGPKRQVAKEYRVSSTSHKLLFRKALANLTIESRIRKQRGREWNARVRAFTGLVWRIHGGHGWTSPKTVFFLTNKRDFAKELIFVINTMLARATSMQDCTAIRNDDSVSLILSYTTIYWTCQ